jgi:SAM-dependent methyltransferase
MDTGSVERAVLEKYQKVAVSPERLFRYPVGEASARHLGYPANILSAIPPQVRERFVGVGDPFALGEIASGQAVLDLGCGAGLDVLAAAQHVGPRGRVVGVDLSPEMLAVAEAGRAEGRFSQVSYTRADLVNLPFGDGAFEVALSNGVLNLVPDKPAALREIVRVLRPGGRLLACDMGLVADEPPPEKSPWSD